MKMATYEQLNNFYDLNRCRISNVYKTVNLKSKWAKKSNWVKAKRNI